MSAAKKTKNDEDPPLVDCQKKIYSILRRLNVLLEYLELAVADYKNLWREEIIVPNRRQIEKNWSLESPVDNFSPEDTDLCWQQLIREQLRELHFFQNFTIKLLCEDYCVFHTCCEVCFKKSQSRC